MNPTGQNRFFFRSYLATSAALPFPLAIIFSATEARAQATISLTQDFTVTVPGSNGSVNINNNLNQFDPALGTLVSLNVSLTRSFIWTSVEPNAFSEFLRVNLNETFGGGV
jgi:hypothetical protein